MTQAGQRHAVTPETILHGDIVLCIVVSGLAAAQSTTFYTPPEAALQVGNIVHPRGEAVAPHSHPGGSRVVTGNPEVIYVRSGRAEVDLFAPDGGFVCTRLLEAGDVAVLLAGGHGFRFHDDSSLLEVRLGPYDALNGRKNI